MGGPSIAAWALIDFLVVRAAGLSRVRLSFGKDISWHVQIDAGNNEWRTKGVAWTKDGDLHWDDRFTLCVSIEKQGIRLNLPCFTDCLCQTRQKSSSVCSGIVDSQSGHPSRSQDGLKSSWTNFSIYMPLAAAKVNSVQFPSEWEQETDVTILRPCLTITPQESAQWRAHGSHPRCFDHRPGKRDRASSG